MIPTIASSGASFKGAAAYYLHDKDASTKERIAWTHVENMTTRDADKAAKIMAWTAMNHEFLKKEAGVKATGRKLQKPVFCFSLSWHPNEKPDQEHMLATAKTAVEHLGLSEYQAIYVAHNDEPQPHVHVIINRVSYENGKAASLTDSKEKLSEWAQAYEKEHGKIYCKNRDEKHNTKSKGGSRKERNYWDSVIEQAWQRSDSGKAFKAALEEQGYHLARGNRRIVVIDKYGKAKNPVRELPRVKAKEFKARLQDINDKDLPTANQVQRQIKQAQRKQYHASRKYDQWMVTYLNKEQDRHLKERHDLHDKHWRKIESKKQELEDYYRIKQLKAEIADLKEKASDNPGLLKRLSGKARSEAQRLEMLELQLKNAEQRTAEQLKPLEKKRDQDFENQTRRHERERQRAHEYIEQKRPDPYRDERDQQKDQTRQPERDRGEGRERTREYRP